MKFLCVECDRPMEFEERAAPGDGTLAVTFTCPGCGRQVAMLTNPMETQLVSSLGVKIGGRTVPAQPLETIRTHVTTGGETALDDGGEAGEAGEGGTASGVGASRRGPAWSPAAQERLARVPGFVRGMVRRLYGEWAKERGIAEITPEVMDAARTELGLEGM